MVQDCGLGEVPQHIDAPNYRLFNCFLCRAQCRVCSRCDHGNIYCKNCQVLAKKNRRKRANQKYRTTKRGMSARARAEKLRRLRQKANSVGDHGSKFTHQTSNLVLASNGAVQNLNSVGEISDENILAGDTQSCSPVVQKQFRCEFCNTPLGIFSRRLGESAKAASFFRRSRKGRPP